MGRLLSMKYSLTDIDAKCPICKGGGVLLYPVDINQSATHFLLEKNDTKRFHKLKMHIKKLWDASSCAVVKCNECGFCYSHPYVAGDSEFYRLAYERKGYPLWKWEYEVTLSSLLDLLSNGSLKKIRLLEIGAGNGAFLDKIIPKVVCKSDCLAMEYSLYGLDELRKKGIRCLDKNFRELKLRDYKNPFSVVCMFQVLEHLDELDNIFKKINSLTTNNAHFFIAVPNEKMIQFNELNGGLLDMPPNHIGRWNSRCFKIIARKHGWMVVSHKYSKPNFLSSLKQFSGSKYAKSIQSRNTLGYKIAMIKNEKLSYFLKVLLIGFYAIRSFNLIKKNFRKLSESQWVHLRKVE